MDSSDAKKPRQAYAYGVNQNNEAECQNMIRSFKNWANHHNHLLIDITIDEIPRQKLKLLCDSMNHGDTIVFYCFENAFKTRHEFCDWIQSQQYKGIEIVSIREGFDTTTPYGRFTILILKEVSNLWDCHDLAELSPDQFEKLKGIIPLNEIQKLEPYIDIVDPNYDSSQSDDSIDVKEHLAF